MELKILEKKKQRLVFELQGADHTLCHALNEELWLDSAVKVATYAVQHPLLAVPKFIIETKGKEAKQALLDAISRLRKEYKQYGSVLSKV